MISSSACGHFERVVVAVSCLPVSVVVHQSNIAVPSKAAPCPWTPGRWPSSPCGVAWSMVGSVTSAPVIPGFAIFRRSFTSSSAASCQSNLTQVGTSDYWSANFPFKPAGPRWAGRLLLSQSGDLSHFWVVRPSSPMGIFAPRSPLLTQKWGSVPFSAI